MRNARLYPYALTFMWDVQVKPIYILYTPCKRIAMKNCSTTKLNLSATVCYLLIEYAGNVGRFFFIAYAHFKGVESGTEIEWLSFVGRVLRLTYIALFYLLQLKSFLSKYLSSSLKLDTKLKVKSKFD